MGRMEAVTPPPSPPLQPSHLRPHPSSPARVSPAHPHPLLYPTHSAPTQPNPPPTPTPPQYECRLCLTLHNNEGNYLAHTQGKRHQQNLAKRAVREAADRAVAPAPARRVALRRTVKIGRPGYRVTKQCNPETGARGLLYQVGRGRGGDEEWRGRDPAALSGPSL